MTVVDQHSTCRHRDYRLTCEQFTDLLERAGHSCELCGRADIRLHIDHVIHGPVRGLLCPKCNALMSHVDRGLKPPTAATEAYRANALPGIAHKQTPPRNFRIPDDLWSQFSAIVKAKDTTAAAVVKAELERYVRRYGANLSDLPAKEHS